MLRIWATLCNLRGHRSGMSVELLASAVLALRSAIANADVTGTGLTIVKVRAVVTGASLE